MAAVPNATIIGFTGTPIAKTEQGEGTFKIFGAEDEQRLSRQVLDQGIDRGRDDATDQAVLAPSEMTVPADRLDKEFFDLAAAEGVTDIEELNKVLDRAVGLRTFLTADDRVEKVAAFVAEPFQGERAAARLQGIRGRRSIARPAPNTSRRSTSCCRRNGRKPSTPRMPPTWSTGPSLPNCRLSEEREEDVRLLFKKADEDPKILIVTDKLLTGYDAPVLYCMYLDKPMRDHVLLQAIARVNRPYVDAEGIQKRIGLVIDFVGVLRELKKALQFDSSDVERRDRRPRSADARSSRQDREGKGRLSRCRRRRRRRRAP